MRNLFKPTSYRKGVSLAVGATALWKILSFVNALLIAAYFGAGSATDLYFYIIMAMGLGTYFLQRLNAAVIIPQAMALDAQSPQKGRALLNGFLYFYILLLALCVLLAGCCPVQVAQILSLFKKTELAPQRLLIVLGILFFGLQLLSYYLTAVLEMYRRFTVALFAPLNALLPLVCLGLWANRAGIVSMMYGFVAAQVIQITVFLTVLKKELDWQFTPWVLFPGRRFTQNLLSNQLMELVNIVNGLLPLYLLSGLAAGLVSALNYAKQLTDSATEVFLLRVTNISKIELSEYAARQQPDLFNRAYLRTHRLLCLGLTPLVVFSVFYAPEIIILFFKRGLFNEQNVHQAAAFLRPLLGILLCMIPTLMQNNAVAAQRKLKQFLPYALSGMLLFTLAVPGAMRVYGPFAYPYTQLACLMIGFGINLFFFKRELPFLAIGKSLWEMVRIVCLNLLALIPAALLTTYVVTGTNPWIILFSGGVVFLAGLGSILYYTQDVQWMRSLFQRQAPLP